MKPLLPCLACAALVMACSRLSVEAGGGPRNVLLVVNDQSIESLEIGQFYQEQRGVPERNVCHVSVNPLLHNLSPTTFESDIRDVVQQHITDHGLQDQIDIILLSRDIPTRVNENEGSTAVMFYGFKNAPLIVTTCTMPANTRSAYYQAERAFSRRDTYGGTNYYLAMALSAYDLVDALGNVSNGVVADGTSPGGTFYLLKPPGDTARNVRYQRFDNFDFDMGFLGDAPDYQLLAANVVFGKTNVMGYLTGVPSYPAWVYRTNEFLPGALADHFTSYGARFPDPPLGQDPIWEWTRAGATASYGTVNEPCAYLEKFPDPLCYFWLSRGFSVAESYWMSVANPYQGLFVGDPLSAPYAQPPDVSITAPSAGACVSGVVTIEVAATTGMVGRTAHALDLYVDDLYSTNLVTVPPTPGNVLSVIVNAETTTYTVALGDSLYDAVDGLADAVNAAAFPVAASNFGDRLMLVYTNYGTFGSGVTYQAASGIGGAAELTVWCDALSTNLEESVYVARELIRIEGTARAGDTVACVITLTNDVVSTNTIVAATGQTGLDLMPMLAGLINADPLLQDTNGARAVDVFVTGDRGDAWLQAREPGPQGYNLHVDFTVTRALPPVGLDESTSFADQFNDNADVLSARGNVMFRRGREPLTASYSWDTTGLPDGPHEVRVVARDGTGVEVQGDDAITVVVSNSSLACYVVSPTNTEPFILGDDVHVDVTVSNAVGGVTQVVVLVEGKSSVWLTTAPYTSAWSTLTYGVGSVGVQAMAYDAAGRCAVSEMVRAGISMSAVLDTDGDDVADDWEQRYLGGLYVYDGQDDPDDDTEPNIDEFVADTDPLDGEDFLEATAAPASSGDVIVTFESSSNRVYEAQFLEGLGDTASVWMTASPTPFPGNGTTNAWVDNGTETGMHPALSTGRVYRVRVTLP